MKAIINGNIEFPIAHFRESFRLSSGTVVRQELMLETLNTDVEDILQKFSDIQSLVIYDDADNQLLDCSGYKNLSRVDRLYGDEHEALICSIILTLTTAA